MKPFPAHLFQPSAQPSFLFQDAWQRLESLPQGNSVPLISKSIPQSPAVGAGGSTVAAGRWRGWGVPWTALVWLWKSLASFPCLSTAFVLIPTQGKTSGCLAEGAQKVKIWSNLQDFGWNICKGCNVHRQPHCHTLSESGKHLLATWKGVKPSGVF